MPSSGFSPGETAAQGESKGLLRILCAGSLSLHPGCTLSPPLHAMFCDLPSSLDRFNLDAHREMLEKELQTPFQA